MSEIREPRLFIIGTGRCGTTALAEALYYNVGAAVVNEPRFLTDPGGLVDLVRGRMELDEFRVAFLAMFCPRMTRNCRRLDPNNCAGIKTLRAEEIYRAILWNTGENAITFAARFAAAILSELVYGNDYEIVVKEPHAMLYVNLLAQLFDGARFVHVIRDPRDVCASVLGCNWGPGDASKFIGWYNRLMDRAWASANQVAPERYLVISFEDMVADPDGVVGKVCRFADLPQPSAVTRISVESAHIGRYRQDLGSNEADEIERRTWTRYGWWRRLAGGL